VRCRIGFKLPAACVRASFSCKLNVPRSAEISAARSADFSTSSSTVRHGLFDSTFASSSDVWPRMLVSALLKSSDTEARQLQSAIQLLFMRQVRIG